MPPTRAPRRSRTWMIQTRGSTVQPAGTTLIEDLLAAGRAARGLTESRGLTISRVLGNLTLVPSTEGGALQGYTVGISVYNRTAAAAAVFPNIATEDLDYLWWKQVHVSPIGNETSSGVFKVFPFYLDIDTRSQRMLRGSDDSLFLGLRNDGAFNVTFGLSFRTLVLLP